MSNMSQAEIDVLLQQEPDRAQETEAPGGNSLPAQAANAGALSCDPEAESGGEEAEEGRAENILEYFSPEEVDALGEIGNICMGTSATTLNMLLGKRVTITTPRVALYKTEDVLTSYGCPFLSISVEFIEGLYGKNLLLLKDYDAALITDLLMGGAGAVEKNNVVLTEIHLSAVSEVMNQMIGSAATAMSNMMGDGVNISPPQVVRVAADESVEKFLDGATPVVRISFDMEIEGLLKSKLLQIMPIEMAKELISSLMHPAEKEESKPVAGTRYAAGGPAPTAKPVPRPAAAAPPAEKSAGAPVAERKPQPVRSVKPVQYESFEEPGRGSASSDAAEKNFDLIHDIPLQVTVELGKTKKNLSDVLNLGIGSIIVLDKQAGELVDVIVNGKRIAKGEVVVIDENYGVRITELTRA